MAVSQDDLVCFFDALALAHQSTDVFGGINQHVSITPDIHMTREGVRFTLKALFSVFRAVQINAVQINKACTYPAFQKQLYSGSLHHALQAKGYSVVIVENHGKISRNVYCLKVVDA